ncbi:hypothetical protein [Nocardia sp. NPDC051570]|uniref:hypothetical protein n=1 Tax=Nocardia sp. NPDC051570 TaxID=3364324 RepID=UPI0037993AF8
MQWHVANKSELLKAATAVAVARAVGNPDPDASPREAIHAVALGVSTRSTHPWIGAQLSRPPWQDTMAEIFERIGRAVQALAASATVQFTSTLALLHYIIGASGQNATNSRSAAELGDRQYVLATETQRWEGLDPEQYAFTRTVAERLRAHDDRAEFLAGIDLILEGMPFSTTVLHVHTVRYGYFDKLKNVPISLNCASPVHADTVMCVPPLRSSGTRRSLMPGFRCSLIPQPEGTTWPISTTELTRSIGGCCPARAGQPAT